jgi:hypothetical protein
LTTRKEKTTPKAVQKPLVDKKVAEQEKAPAKKVGRPKSTKVSPTEQTKTKTKTGRSNSNAKTKAAIEKKPAPKTSKPRVSTKSVADTEKKPASRRGGARSVRTPTKKAGQTRSTKGQITKTAPSKPATRKKSQGKFTVNSAIAPTVIILPPSWKPQRSKPIRSRRRLKPDKPKSGR